MSVTLLIKELNNYLKGTIIISFAIAFYIVFSLSMYSIIQENLAKIYDFYSAIPESLRMAFNFHLNQWNSILVFYVTYFVYFIPVIVGCYSIFLGMKLLSKEEQNKTAEFLLSRPVSREQIVSSKLLTFFIHILSINLIAFGVALFSCGIVTDWDFSIKILFVLHSYGFLMCLFWGVLGFFITVIMKRAKAIVGIGIGIVLGSYYFDMLIRISGKLQFLLYLTPFKYINLDVYSDNYGFDGWRLLFFGGTSISLIVLSYLFYKKKDILI
jgi:ABC-2 type transport system permease protein